MFYRMYLTAEIDLHPSFFGKDLADTVRKRLVTEKAGKSEGKYGYILSILNIDDKDIGAGVVDSTSGYAKFIVRYEALLVRPFKNEVCDAVVDHVTQLGFFAQLGPFGIFCTRNRFPPDFKSETRGGKNVWKSEDGETVIEEGTHVRIKIVSATLDSAQLSAVACIDEDYLGVI